MDNHLLAENSKVYNGLSDALEVSAHNLEYLVFGIGNAIAAFRWRDLLWLPRRRPILIRVERAEAHLRTFRRNVVNEDALTVLIEERLRYLEEKLKSYGTWAAKEFGELLEAVLRWLHRALSWTSLRSITEFLQDALAPTVSRSAVSRAVKRLRPSSYLGLARYQDTPYGWFWTMMFDVWMNFLGVVGLTQSLFDIVDWFLM